MILDLIATERVGANGFPVAQDSHRGLNDKYPFNQAFVNALEESISHKLSQGSFMNNSRSFENLARHHPTQQQQQQQQYGTQTSDKSYREVPLRRSSTPHRRSGVLRCVPKAFRPSSLLNEQVPIENHEIISHQHKPDSQVKLNHSDIELHGGGDSPKIIVLPQMAGDEEEEDPNEIFREPLPADYEEFLSEQQNDYEDLPESYNQEEEGEPDKLSETVDHNKTPTYTDNDDSTLESNDYKQTSETSEHSTIAKTSKSKNAKRLFRPSVSGKKKLLWKRFKRPKWVANKQANNSIPIGGRPRPSDKISIGTGSSGNFTRTKRQAKETFESADESTEGESKPENSGDGIDRRDDDAGSTGSSEKPPAEETSLEDDDAELPHVSTSNEDESREISPRQSLNPIVDLISGLFRGGGGGGGLGGGGGPQTLFGTILGSLTSVVTQLIDVIIRTASSEIPKQLFSFIQTVIGILTSLLGFGSRADIRNSRDVETFLAPLKAMQQSLISTREQRNLTKEGVRSPVLKRLNERFARLRKTIRLLVGGRADSPFLPRSNKAVRRNDTSKERKPEAGKKLEDTTHLSFVVGVNNLTQSSVQKRSLTGSNELTRAQDVSIRRLVGRPRAKRRAKRSIPMPLRTLLVYGPFSKFYMTMMLHRLVRQQSSFLAQAVMAELVRRFVVPSLIGSIGSNGSSASGNAAVNAFNQLKQAIMGSGSSGLITSASTNSETLAQPTSNVFPKTDMANQQTTVSQTGSSQRPNLHRTSGSYESTNDCELSEPEEETEEGSLEDQQPLIQEHVRPQPVPAPIPSAIPLTPAAISLSLSSIQPMQQVLQALAQGNLLSQYMKDPAISANSKGISLKLPNSQTTLTVPNLINGEHSLYGLMTKMLQATTTLANQQYQQQQQPPVSPQSANGYHHMPFDQHQQQQFPFEVSSFGQLTMNRNKTKFLDESTGDLPLDIKQLLKQAQSPPEYPHLLPSVEENISTGFQKLPVGQTNQELLLNNMMMSDSNDKHEISQSSKSFVESALKGAPEAELLKLFTKLQQNGEQFNQLAKTVQDSQFHPLSQKPMTSASQVPSNKSIPLSADMLAHNILNKTLELSLSTYLNPSNNSLAFGKDSLPINDRNKIGPSTLIKETSELLSKSFAELVKGLDFETTKVDLRMPSSSDVSQINLPEPITRQQESPTPKTLPNQPEELEKLPMLMNKGNLLKQSPLQIILNTDSALALMDKIMSHHKSPPTSFPPVDSTKGGERESNKTNSNSNPLKPIGDDKADTLLQTTPLATGTEQEELLERPKEEVSMDRYVKVPQLLKNEGGPSLGRLVRPASFPLGHRQEQDYHFSRPMTYKDDLEEPREDMMTTGKLGASSRNNIVTIQRNTIGQVKQMPAKTRNFPKALGEARQSIQGSRLRVTSVGNSTSRFPAAYEDPPAQKPTGNLYMATRKVEPATRQIDSSKRTDSLPPVQDQNQQPLQAAASLISNETVQPRGRIVQNVTTNIVPLNGDSTSRFLPVIPKRLNVAMFLGQPPVVVDKLEGTPVGHQNHPKTSSIYSNFDYARDFPGSPNNNNGPMEHKTAPIRPKLEAIPYPEENKNALNNLAMALNVMNMVLLNQKIANNTDSLLPASPQAGRLPARKLKTKTKGPNLNGSSQRGTVKWKSGVAGVGRQPGPLQKQAPKGSINSLRKRPTNPGSAKVELTQEKGELGGGSVEAVGKEPTVGDKMSPAVGEVEKSSVSASIAANSMGKNHRTSTNTIRLNSTILLAPKASGERLNISAPSYLFQPLPIAATSSDGAYGLEHDGNGTPVGGAATSGGPPLTVAAQTKPDALDEPEREHATRWNDVLQHISVKVKQPNQE